MVKNAFKKMEMPDSEKLSNTKRKRGGAQQQQQKREATIGNAAATAKYATTTATTTQSTKRVNKHHNDVEDAVRPKLRFGNNSTAQDDIDDDYFEDDDDDDDDDEEEEEAEGSETDLLDDDDDDDVDDEATLLISSDEEEFLETQRISLPELIVKKLLHSTTTAAAAAATTTTTAATPAVAAAAAAVVPITTAAPTERTAPAMNAKTVEGIRNVTTDVKWKEPPNIVKESPGKSIEIAQIDESIDEKTNKEPKVEKPDQSQCKKEHLEREFPKPMLEPKLEEIDEVQHEEQSIEAPIQPTALAEPPALALPEETNNGTEETTAVTKRRRGRKQKPKPKPKLTEANNHVHVHVDGIKEKRSSKQNVNSATSSTDKHARPVLGHISFFPMKQTLSYQCTLCKKTSFNEFNAYTQHLRTNHQVLRCLEQPIMVVIPPQRKSARAQQQQQQLEQNITKSSEPMPETEVSNMDLKTEAQDVDAANAHDDGNDNDDDDDQPKDDKENILSDLNKRNAEQQERDSYYACGFVELQEIASLCLVCKYCNSVQIQEEHFKKHLLLEHQSLLPEISTIDEEKGKQSPVKEDNFKRNCLLPTIQESNVLAAPALETPPPETSPPETPPPETPPPIEEQDKRNADEKSLNDATIPVEIAAVPPPPAAATAAVVVPPAAEEEISSVETISDVLQPTTSLHQADETAQKVNANINDEDEQIQEARQRRQMRQRVCGNNKSALSAETDVEQKTRRVRKSRSSQESRNKTRKRKAENEISNSGNNDIQLQQSIEPIETILPESTDSVPPPPAPSTQIQRKRRRTATIKCAPPLKEPKKEDLDISSNQQQTEEKHLTQESASETTAADWSAASLLKPISNENVRTAKKRKRVATHVARKQTACSSNAEIEDTTEEKVKIADLTINCNESDLNCNDNDNDIDSQQKPQRKQKKQRQRQKKRQANTNTKRDVECDICQKSFKKTSRLIEHRRLHTGEKPFECDKCDKKFRTKARLTVHKLRHLGIRAFQCHICSLAVATKQDLAQHQRYHTGIRPHACPHCPKAFVRPSDLKIHLRVHTGEKPYVCDVCNQSFRAKQNLYVHKKTHLGVKDFVCEFCNKRFMRKIDLRVHMRVHTGEKPYKCEICGRGFSSKFNVRTHIERFHVANANGTGRRKPGQRSNVLRAELERQKELIEELRNQLAQHIKTEEETIQQHPHPHHLTNVIPSTVTVSDITAVATGSAGVTTTTNALQIITSNVMQEQKDHPNRSMLMDQQQQGNFELPIPMYGMPTAVHTLSLTSSGSSSSSSSSSASLSASLIHSPQLQAQKPTTTTTTTTTATATSAVLLKNGGTALPTIASPQSHDISILAVFTAQPHGAVHLNDLATDGIAATTTPLRLQLPNRSTASSTQKKERKIDNYFNVMGQKS